MSAIGTRKSLAWIPPALAASLFALISLALLPYPGLEEDEVLFVCPIYQRGGALFNLKIAGHAIPIMLISYLGALKTWVYAIFFEFLIPSRWSVRAPMVLVGVATIWLTWLWTRRVAGTRAAAFTVVLLSTDAAFIMTNTFDWGPVGFQHFFLMGGLLAIQIWLETDSKRMLAVGSFLWGLGLWDKALMIWPLVGLAVAVICVYPRELLRRLRSLPIGIVCAALFLGALPLIYYNVRVRGETVSGNAKISLSQIPSKFDELHDTLNGSVLLDALAQTTPGPLPQTPTTLIEKISAGLKNHLGSRSANLMLPAIALSLLSLPFLVRKASGRLLIFILIAVGIAWLQMASNTGTGGGAHHVILLWPFPCVFVGIALAGLSDLLPRAGARAVVALVACLVGANLLNANEYLADMIQNGAATAWSDAVYRLAGAVYRDRSRQIGVVDWGYANPLLLMYEGDLHLTMLAEFLRKPVMSDNDRARAGAIIASPDFIFIQHTDGNQMFVNVNDRLRGLAADEGYTEQVQRTVHDNEGRAIYEIFRFVKASP